MRTNSSSTVFENESLSEICHCLEKRPQLACPFSNQSTQHRDQVAEIAFLSLKCLKVFFQVVFVLSACTKVKPLPSWCAAVHRTIRGCSSPWQNRNKHAQIRYTQIGYTLFSDCLLLLFTRISSFPSLLISSSCRICDRSLFLHHWGSESLICFLFFLLLYPLKKISMLPVIPCLLLSVITQACMLVGLNGSRRHLWCTVPQGLSDCECLFPCRDLCSKQWWLWQHVSWFSDRSSLQLSCWIHSAARPQDL